MLQAGVIQSHSQRLFNHILSNEKVLVFPLGSW